MSLDEPVQFLTLEDILAAGSVYLGAPPKVRDFGLLEAAVLRPQSVVFGQDVYPGIHHKAAALVHSLVTNHALVDGNKRLGLAGLRLFYAMNMYTFTATDDEKFDLLLDIAAGTIATVNDIAERLAPLAQPPS